MDKLFSLKEWLTIEDTARHLSIVFDETVGEADILRLALDGHLRLLDNFLNKTQARIGKCVGYEDAEWHEMSPDMAKMVPNLPDEAKGKPIHVMDSLKIDENRYLNLGDTVETIEGVWDLPMIGGESLDIEH